MTILRWKFYFTLSDWKIHRRTTLNICIQNSISSFDLTFNIQYFTKATVHDILKRFRLWFVNRTSTIVRNRKTLRFKHCTTTSDEATRPTLPNTALNAWYVDCFAWLHEQLNVLAELILTPKYRRLSHHSRSRQFPSSVCLASEKQ